MQSIGPYQPLKVIAEGNHSVIVQASRQDPNAPPGSSLVALKCLKERFQSIDDVKRLREVATLRRLPRNQRIVQLQEVRKEGTKAVLVYECMGNNLGALIQHRIAQSTDGGPATKKKSDIISKQVENLEVLPQKNPPPSRSVLQEAEVKQIMLQLLQGLEFIHQHGIMHCDVRPANVFVNTSPSTDGPVEVKIGGFDLSRAIPRTPGEQPDAMYIMSRWYYAPELVLNSPHYGPAVDIWGAGLVMAEMILGYPLLPGYSEADQWFKICQLIDVPSDLSWCPNGKELLLRLGLTDFPSRTRPGRRGEGEEGRRDFVKAFSGYDLSTEALDLMRWMLSMNPNERPSAFDCLAHSFFTVLQ